MRSLTITDWLTPDSLVLSLSGVLDDAGCGLIASRLDHLLRWWPGIRVTLDFTAVDAIDASAAEDLFLGIVARRARSGMLSMVAPSGPCLTLLNRLAIPAVSPGVMPGIALESVFRPAVTS